MAKPHAELRITDVAMALLESLPFHIPLAVLLCMSRQ